MQLSEVILGVDTHLNVHVGALISDTGQCLGTLSVTTDAAGPNRLRKACSARFYAQARHWSGAKWKKGARSATAF